MTVVCPKCTTTNRRRINQIYAKPNPITSLLGLVAGIVITIALWDIMGAIGTISITIPILIWKQQDAVCSTFNNYRIQN